MQLLKKQQRELPILMYEIQKYRSTPQLDFLPTYCKRYFKPLFSVFFRISWNNSLTLHQKRNVVKSLHRYLLQMKIYMRRKNHRKLLQSTPSVGPKCLLRTPRDNSWKRFPKKEVFKKVFCYQSSQHFWNFFLPEKIQRPKHLAAQLLTSNHISHMVLCSLC